jgi:hypothetical protein
VAILAKQFLFSCFLSSSASCCGTLLKVMADTDPDIKCHVRIAVKWVISSFFFNVRFIASAWAASLRCCTF